MGTVGTAACHSRVTKKSLGLHYRSSVMSSQSGTGSLPPPCLSVNNSCSDASDRGLLLFARENKAVRFPHSWSGEECLQMNANNFWKSLKLSSHEQLHRSVIDSHCQAQTVNFPVELGLSVSLSHMLPRGPEGGGKINPFKQHPEWRPEYHRSLPPLIFKVQASCTSVSHLYNLFLVLGWSRKSPSGNPSARRKYLWHTCTSCTLVQRFSGAFREPQSM